MEFKQAHRLENLHVSGTRVVFGKCAELAAQGIPVTALTLGQPDFDTPQYIIDACKKALDEGKTRYTDGSGSENHRLISALYICFCHNIGRNRKRFPQCRTLEGCNSTVRIKMIL